MLFTINFKNGPKRGYYNFKMESSNTDVNAFKKRNFFDRLGVQLYASVKECKEAYIPRCEEYKNHDDILDLIREAHESLNKINKRKAYIHKI